MNESQSALTKWLDRDFWNQGSYLTSADGETVILGKGGSVSVVSSFELSGRPVFYLKDFYKNSYLAYSPDTILECTKEEMEDYLKSVTIPPVHISPIENDDDLYQKDFELLKSSFKKGLEKVVLVSRETYEAFEGEETIKRLLKKSFEFGVGFPYGFWTGSYGVVGSTPELLYDVDFDTLKTFALAGTVKKGNEEVLLNSRKDRHEHDLVIKDIKEKLSKFSVDVEVMETELHPYKDVVHLKTDIEATIEEDLDLTSLTSTLSPTAALGGYPKEAALAFLEQSNYAEKYGERYFGSCFGLISEDMKEFVVSIRNVQWQAGHLFIESGGGVVTESDYQKELAEIHLKREMIRNFYL